MYIIHTYPPTPLSSSPSPALEHATYNSCVFRITFYSKGLHEQINARTTKEKTDPAANPKVKNQIIIVPAVPCCSMETILGAAIIEHDDRNLARLNSVC